MSRIPASDICSVRGIGVALIAITSTRSFSWLQQLLLLDAEALLLVDDQQPQVLGAHVAREQPVGADQDVHLAVARSAATASRCSAAGRKRETCSIVTG